MVSNKETNEMINRGNRSGQNTAAATNQTIDNTKE